MREPLHLVRFVLDRRAVIHVGVRHRLGRMVDEGALLHAGLSQLFANSTARVILPFRSFAVDDIRAATLQQPDRLFLLAYSRLDGAQLMAAMGPARSELLLACESRRMPAFESGQRLGFRTRICPVVRTRQTCERPLAQGRNGRLKHREIDAFIHAMAGVPRTTPLDREEVYRAWLRRQLERTGAGAIETASMTEFRRETLRRDGRVERPNVLMDGTMSVGDPEAFCRMLARGLGRHRTYGFGMLLLRPASR